MSVLFKLCFLISGANAANILGVVLSGSYSHQIVFVPLWRELSLRGHQVTTITTHPIKDPKLVNLTEIDVGFIMERSENFMKKVIDVAKTNYINEMHYFMAAIAEVFDLQLDYGPVKKLINNKEAQFDLVILEYLWATPLAFTHRFNCPFIGMLSIDAMSPIHKFLGNPTHSSLYPDNILPFGDKLTLFQRVISFLNEYVAQLYIGSKLFAIEQELISKHFGSNYPPLEQLASNISMLFINSDPIFHHNRPMMPNIVQIGGGSHITPPQPLPKELQETLDKAVNGFIYFSLGSNVQSDFLSESTVEMMMEIFSELPYTVLWKFKEQISNKPSNVITSKWLPQQDVLRHPNIKLFITQGGLQSIDEAIHSHVPMVGMPFFGDQPYNVKKMVNKGYGLELDYKNLKKSEFKEAILEVINNPRYRDTIIKLAELAQDQPMTGIEKAVWWTEYVIRHKGAKHLRSPLLDVPWYQYLLLDVIAALLLGFLAIMYIFALIIRALIRIVKFVASKKAKAE